MATKYRVTWRWCQGLVFTDCSRQRAQAGLMTDTCRDHLHGSWGNTLQVISGMEVEHKHQGAECWISAASSSSTHFTLCAYRIHISAPEMCKGLVWNYKNKCSKTHRMLVQTKFHILYALGGRRYFWSSKIHTYARTNGFHQVSEQPYRRTEMCFRTKHLWLSGESVQAGSPGGHSVRAHLLKPSSDEQQEFCDSKRYYTLEPTRAQDLSGFPTKTVETEQKWCRCYGEGTQVFLLPANTFLSALHTHSQDGTLPSFPDNLHHSRWMKGPHSRVLKNIRLVRLLTC